MKKITIIHLLILLWAMLLSGCLSHRNAKGVTEIIIPDCAPSLAISDFLYHSQGNTSVRYDIVTGTDLIIVAFSTSQYDIIVAPICMGAKMYNKNALYMLNAIIVWGNYYIVSKTPINSITDLAGKEITSFGKFSTPDIMLNKLIDYHGIDDLKINYVSDVNTVQGLFLSGTCGIVLCAEPFVSAIQSQTEAYVLDLQEVWRKMEGNSLIPQAGVFVLNSKEEDPQTQAVLDEIRQSVEVINEKKESVALEATQISETFASLGADVLTSAIPRGSFQYQTAGDGKQEVNAFFELVTACGQGDQIGGVIPDENFYQS